MNAKRELNLLDKYALCTRVLTGYDENNNKNRISMFDPGVISFTHANGIRRPHTTTIAAAVHAVLNTEESSLDDYLFLRRLASFDQAITEKFISEGIDEDTAQEICIDSGTIRIALAYLSVVAQKDDVFLAGQSFYRGLLSWCNIAGVQLICVPTQSRNGYKLTAEDLNAWYEQNIHYLKSKKPKGIFLFNPTPIGAVYDESEFKSLARFILDNDLIAFEDTVFMGTEFDPNKVRTHLASCIEAKGRVLTVAGSSKAYGLANLRIGWGCGPKALIEKMNNYITATGSSVSQISKLMALAALQAPISYLHSNAQECEERVHLILDLISEANMIIKNEIPWYLSEQIIRIEYMPQAGHSILLSFNEMQGLCMNDGSRISNSVDITRFFLNESKIALSPCLDSGFNGCEVRLSFGCVGSKFTYANTHESESLAVLETVLTYLDRELAHKMQHHLDDYKMDSKFILAQNQSNTFLEGRHLIREGILSRMVPAIIRLLAENKKYDDYLTHLNMASNPNTRAVQYNFQKLGDFKNAGTG